MSSLFEAAELEVAVHTLDTYQDPSLTIEHRVEDLLSRMQLAEKVGQMLQLDAHLDLHEVVSVRLAGSVLHAAPDRIHRVMELAALTRLGIPMLIADDCIHGHSFWPGATIFPTQLAMGATWDSDLLQRVARASAAEVAATGIHWTFSPVLCLARDLRWGRVGETFGEDPYLAGELGAAMIRGYQGSGPGDPTAILACAKHFAGYSETQGGRDASESDISPRKLRSWHLPPFERAVRENPRGIMMGYQAMDGVPLVANHWLLSDVLRTEWGFSGVAITDWDSVGRLVWEQQVCADIAQAAAIAVRAGCDLIMSTPDFFDGAQEAVRSGLLGEDEIDAAVRRILRLKFELGLFENPRGPDLERQVAVIGCDEHAQLNLDVARRSLVLLTNDGTLPLDGGLSAGPDGRALTGDRPRVIAIVGANADDPHAQLGDWAGSSGQVDWMLDGHPRVDVETVVDGFRAVAPKDWVVRYVVGAEVGELGRAGDLTYTDEQNPAPVFVPAPVVPATIDAARALAHAADYVVAVVGDVVALTGEQRSTATLELQGAQRALLDALAESGTPMVVVLVNSKPAVLPESVLNAAALIQAFNPGMRGGRAIAELVLGLIEPTGRLPVSFARHAGQQPVYYNQIRGQHGNRYADLSQDPLFAFGQGLSYTEVEYSELRVVQAVVGFDDLIRAELILANRGTRPALETVQIYVRDSVASVTWAERELKGFKQVAIGPGESLRIALELPAASCTIVDADGQRRIEAGDFELLVGPSSRDVDLLRSTFTIKP
jgi:beta-glucosidase